MKKCWICEKEVSKDFDHAQLIEIGTLKKKYVQICDECSKDLGVIENLGSTGEEIDAVISKFMKKTEGNSKAKEYIEYKLKKYKRKMDTYKKVYYVNVGKGLVPGVCINCLEETKKKKTVAFNEIERISARKNKVTSMKIKLPLCTNCRKNKTGFNVRLENMNTLVFTNKKYAQLYALANNVIARETEETGELRHSAMNLVKRIHRYTVLIRIWIARIILICILGIIVRILLAKFNIL